MSDYLRRTQDRAAKSSGNVLRNILIFLGGTILIVAAVISFQNSGRRPLPSSYHPEDFVDDAPVAGADDSAYAARGFQPNRPAADNATLPASDTSAARFIGDNRYHMYHRPNCKTLSFLEDADKFSLASAEEASRKGLIPCKVCQPEPPRIATQPDAKPPKPDGPVSLPIKDVEVPFPFTVTSRDVIVEKGVVRVEFEVDVDKPLSGGDVLLLAQKLVAQEIAKQPVNAVSLFVHTNPKRGSMVKWVGSADWAPYGNLTRAAEVKAGDYRTHKFSSGPFQGFFNPNAR